MAMSAQAPQLHRDPANRTYLIIPRWIIRAGFLERGYPRKADGGPEPAALSLKGNFVHFEVLVNGWPSFSKRLSFAGNPNSCQTHQFWCQLVSRNHRGAK